MKPCGAHGTCTPTPNWAAKGVGCTADTPIPGDCVVEFTCDCDVGDLSVSYSGDRCNTNYNHLYHQRHTNHLDKLCAYHCVGFFSSG